MGPSKLVSNSGKVILGLCVIFGLWFLGANMDLSTNSGDAAVKQTLSVQTGEIRAVSSETQNNISLTDVTKITNATDMLALGMGANFSLSTEFNGESNTITLEVFNVAQNAKFTQIQAQGPNGNVAVITLTPTLTNILLKTSTNIFEYTGGDFRGILNQVARLNLSDDVRETRSRMKPIQNDFKPKKISER